MNQQLALEIQLHDHATLADFCWTGNPILQQQLLATLNHANDRLLYIWGPNGSGKTHLLQACSQAMSHHGSTMYLPLSILNAWGPNILDDLDDQTLISIDDIESVAGDPDWEEALFHLYNRVRDNEKTILLISGKTPPANLKIRLPDLQSRLNWGLVMQLHELADQDKIATLKLHAHRRGLELSDSVIRFLMNRCARNMNDLHALLDRLDEASLIAQRKLTIPFVKHTLGL